jgi:hypothetical protein
MKRGAIAFVEDPDGYRIELIQKGAAGRTAGPVRGGGNARGFVPYPAVSSIPASRA